MRMTNKIAKEEIKSKEAGWYRIKRIEGMRDGKK